MWYIPRMYKRRRQIIVIFAMSLVFIFINKVLVYKNKKSTDSIDTQSATQKGCFFRIACRVSFFLIRPRGRASQIAILGIFEYYHTATLMIQRLKNGFNALFRAAAVVATDRIQYTRPWCNIFTGQA